jgi:hypothetical protein
MACYDPKFLLVARRQIRSRSVAFLAVGICLAVCAILLRVQSVSSPLTSVYFGITVLVTFGVVFIYLYLRRIAKHLEVVAVNGYERASLVPFRDAAFIRLLVPVLGQTYADMGQKVLVFGPRSGDV